jgi:hypothetical protein
LKGGAGPLFEIFGADNSDDCLPLVAQLDLAGWKQLVQHARTHKCAPMLLERLRELGLVQNIPPNVHDELTQITRTTALRNLLAVHQLDELADRLSTSIPLILLKGGCFARTVYRDISLRPMIDLDLLVKQEHCTMVSAQLRSLGYAQDPRKHRESCQHQAQFVRSGCLPIEVHLRFLDRAATFPIDYEAIFTRAQTVSALRGLWSLSSEDHLVHVCLHAVFNHLLNIGLYALIDVAVLVKASDLNWSRLIERTFEWKAQRCVYLVLRMAETLARAEIPASVMDLMAPHDFSTGILNSAIAAIQGFRPPQDSVAFTVALIRRLGTFEGWGSLPDTLRHRFLVRAELRRTWGNSRQSNWLGQIAPLLLGAAAMVRNSDDRRHLQASHSGARVIRWLAQQ